MRLVIKFCHFYEKLCLKSKIFWSFGHEIRSMKISILNIFITEVIMVLGASFEFDKSNNPEIIERPSDNEEVPQVRHSFYQPTVSLFDF